MSTISPDVTVERDGLLRRALVADAIVSGATGLLLAAAAGELADLLGLAVPFLRFVGISLLPYAAVVMLIASRDTISRRGAWAIVGLNLLWAIDSIALLLTGWVDPTALGIAFTIAQALIVAAFADLQYLGLRRSA